MRWFTQIFKDNNQYNEKTIIGFISFAVMVITAITDMVCSILGIDLQIREYIYDSFATITLGSFGIAGLEKFSPVAKLEAQAEAERYVSRSVIPTETTICETCGSELNP